MDKKQLKVKANALDPSINIGKKGLTDSLVEEIKLKLRKQGMIKIKALKSLENRKELAEELVDKTNSQLISKVGFVYVIARK